MNEGEYEAAVPGLDACPHCGHAVEMRRVENTGDYQIDCGECPWIVTVHGPVAAMDAVVQAWNRRS